jgi:hypothetical protein
MQTASDVVFGFLLTKLLNFSLLVIVSDYCKLESNAARKMGTCTNLLLSHRR